MSQRLLLRISSGFAPLLEVHPNDSVLVPMDREERRLCREALEDAIKLLADTAPCLTSFAEPVASDEPDAGLLLVEWSPP